MSGELTNRETTKPSDQSCRVWLRSNGYEQIALMIDEIIEEWQTQGKATRRNWWQVLAGDSRGNPRKIAGRTFPIIAAIRKRQALPKCKAAKRGARREAAPKIKPTGRWPGRILSA
jgi:hypothetical protein